LSKGDFDWLTRLEEEDLVPDAPTIADLAKALSVPTRFLLESSGLRILDVKPRNGHKLSASQLKRVEVEALDFAHRCLVLDLSAMGLRTKANHASGVQGKDGY